MVRRTDPKEDNWQLVKDPKKRKAIQDRLAQRARRQRLREARDQKTQHTTTTNITTTSRRCNCDPTSHTPVQDVHAHAHHPIYTLDADLDSLLALPPTGPILDFLPNDNLDIDFITSNPINPDPYLLSPQSQLALQPPLTIFSALYLNGLTLSLSCTACLHTPSPPATPNHPPTLHPTAMQLITSHPRWFDRLPFPRMRDSLIRLTEMGVLDEEAFLRDLFTMESWKIETDGVGWSRSAWDTRGWKMDGAWMVKWGWLM